MYDVMNEMRKVSKLLVTICLLATTSFTFAAETYVMTAPPRESEAKGIKTYQPIAKFLSKVLNKNIVYQQPNNWLSYTMKMRDKKYDIVFDGPHFVSWRIKHIQHVPLVKIPGAFIFRFVTDNDHPSIHSLNDLVGKRVCGHPPPNQGTLRLYDQFPNPVRLPILVPRRGWRQIYQAMQDGHCDVAILPDKIYKKVDPNADQSRVIYSSTPVSGQALTAGPRFSRQEIELMKKALLSSEGKAACKNLTTRFATPALVDANPKEYEGVDRLLKHSYGFREDNLFQTGN